MAFVTKAEEKTLNYKQESEVSLLSVSGNSDLKSYNLRQLSTLSFKAHELTLKGLYTNGENQGVRSAENWIISLRYGHELSEKVTLFASPSVESNRFAGLDKRYNADLGAKYFFLKKTEHELLSEAGYRYTVEKKFNRTTGQEVPDQKDQRARLYVEDKYQINPYVSSLVTCEYIPNFTESNDWLLNAQTSLMTKVNSFLHLKVSHQWNYDNMPAAGSVKMDRTFSTSLLASF